MKILIVDDEPVMWLTMERMLKPFDDVEIVASFGNAAQALAFLSEQEVDLVFVDIQIANDNGLELARKLRDMSADLDIVFVTSHREYALDAFEAYPLDYIVKPISKQRLAQTMNKAMLKRQDRHRPSIEQSISSRLSVRGLGCMVAASPLAGDVKWISRKSQELFAYLVVRKGRSVAKVSILEDVFPDRTLKNREAYLHTCVYQLRQALAPHGMKEMVHTTNEQYRLDLDGVDVDFIEFEKAAIAMSAIHKNNIAKAMELEQRYTSDLFTEKSYDWSLAERERLAAIYENFVKKLVRALMEQHRFIEAQQIASKILQHNELDEDLNKWLLRIYGHLNKRQMLKNHYEHYSELLKRELNLDPSHEITAIYNQFHQ